VFAHYNLWDSRIECRSTVQLTGFTSSWSEIQALQLPVEVPEASDSGIIPVASESAIVSVALVEKVNSTEKAIVFSQWTSMLDLLETPLKQAGFCYRRLDGTMSVVARDRAVSVSSRGPVLYQICGRRGICVLSGAFVISASRWWVWLLESYGGIATGDSDDHVSESCKPW
jgi:hypothetical protein